MCQKIEIFMAEEMDFTSEKMDYTTAPCKWTERDAEYMADYDMFKELGLKDVNPLDIKELPESSK